MERIKLELVPGGCKPIIHASQYDIGRQWWIELLNNGVPYVLQEGDTVEYAIRKGDGLVVTGSIAFTPDATYVILVSTEQMCAVYGSNLGELKISSNGAEIGTGNFILDVEKMPEGGDKRSQSEIYDLQSQVDNCTQKALENIGAKGLPFDNTDTDLEATNTEDAIKEVDAKVDGKADSDSVYTKEEVNQIIDNLPEAMIFKGTLGVGGTIQSLPTASADNEGYTYKVITAGTYAGQSADVGDMFTSNGSEWVLIPAGDEDAYTKQEADDKFATLTELESKADSDTVEAEFDEIRSVDNADLLYNKPIHNNYFINDETGVGTTNAGFYSYELIEIPSGYLRLYPYNNVSATVDYIRSVCFYDNDKEFISGVSGSHTTVVNGINIPVNAKYVSCSLAKATSGYDGSHFLSTIISGAKLTIPLKEEVEIDSKQIINPYFDDNNVRMPCINFQFDDGHDKDADIVAIFDAHHLRCGFSLITTKSDYVAWLRYQAKGYEILSHSTDVTGMDDSSVSSDTIEAKLKNSKESLEAQGFVVNGFVTPNSTMADKFKPLLRKYYQFAETVYLGAYSGTGTPYQKPYDGIYNGFRVALHTTTLANQKAAVDECIANYGCLTFYGHGFELDAGGYMSTANLNELLSYIEEKIANGKCICDTPTKAITKYFNVRNDDVSQDWLTLAKEDVNLDSRFNVNAWKMSYSMKQKLVAFTMRINPKEDISGQINPIFKFPFHIDGDFLVQNETGRNCLIYDDGLLLQGSGTWTTGTNYRFSAVLKIR